MARRTKAIIEAELCRMEAEFAELRRLAEEYRGLDGEAMLVRIDELAEENRGLNEQLTHSKQEVLNKTHLLEKQSTDMRSAFDRENALERLVRRMSEHMENWEAADLLLAMIKDIK